MIKTMYRIKRENTIKQENTAASFGSSFKGEIIPSNLQLIIFLKFKLMYVINLN